MKESIRSLRAYFILCALLGGFVEVGLLSQSQGNIIIVINALLGLGFSIAYFWIGIALRRLLVKSSKIIVGVILASMAFFVLGFLLSLLGGVQGRMVFQLILGLLITWYLLRNVKRLSLEEQAKRIDSVAP